MWGGDRKPTLVSHFVGPLQARHMFVNPQLCRLVGHSQEDLLFSKPRTFMILVPDKTWLLHRLLFGTGYVTHTTTHTRAHAHAHTHLPIISPLCFILLGLIPSS
jgi:PAS domain-containing protein